MAEEKTLEQLQQENDSLKAENENLKAENEKLSDTVSEQAETIITLKAEKLSSDLKPVQGEPKPAIPAKPVSVDGKQYSFNLAAFVLPAYGRLTAEEASTDEAILKAIIAIPGQGILKELV